MITPEMMHNQKDNCEYSPIRIQNLIARTMREQHCTTVEEYQSDVEDCMLHFIPFIPAYSRVVAYESIEYALTDEFVAMMLLYFINWDYKEEDIPTLVKAIQISVLPELQVHLDEAGSHDNAHTFWFRDDILQLMNNLICSQIRNDDKLTRVLKTYRNVMTVLLKKQDNPWKTAIHEMGKIVCEGHQKHVSVYNALFLDKKDEDEETE